ncbi:putative N-acetyl-LL-diaminopimelate aminotransferase [Clostridium tepidiprofundi DSM 19306]|uniref:Aminotransferase n=1 Tax=Clostridium tepidiprofundi DSM 19306 TaxID=1121338 RepID=A0A151B6Y8_9CLOT|nr:aminotransferase class I/II-fold pyridoxal phosphate-dependent enzyme [Clostridium tepidiprofundi]KYH35563.1 putative N-acetyl-LL-diaminopimelate aminotransferase [Clostridium tepidiprofundi DSM 19306]
MDELFSKKIQYIEISGIRKFYNKVNKVDGVVSLTLGQPDFAVPELIKKEICDAIINNKTMYTANEGILELRSEISNYLKKRHINYYSDEICITVGGSEGIMDVFAVFLNEGDNVLVPTPAYPAYENCIKVLGGNVINYKLNDDFSLNYDELQKLIKHEKPKLLVVSYPCNPTGAILSKKDSEILHDIVKNNDLIVISDEMYSSLCYDEYYSISQYDDIKHKVVLVGGFSKMFSMTGLRVGYVCGTKAVVDNVIKFHQYNVSCAPSIAQWGAYRGLKSCLSDVEYMKKSFMKRRDFMYSELNRLGFDVILPKGAFYIFPSIKKFGIKSDEFCERMLKEAKVAVVPGSAFGYGGEGYIRISYSYSMEELREAIMRIEEWLKRI